MATATAPSSSIAPLPRLTSAQVRELDRLCGQRFGIPVDWLMEAAGWQVARHCRGRVAVLAGAGNNGGDALAAARHLHRWGRLHSVACLDAGRLTGAAGRQLDALRAVGVEPASELSLEGANLLLDGIFGTGLTRAPEGVAREWIEAVNRSGLRVVAIDLPSGLVADTGATPGVAVRADQTVTLGLPKTGMLAAACGEIWVADIGIPAAAFAEIGVALPDHLFAMHDRVQLVEDQA